LREENIEVKRMIAVTVILLLGITGRCAQQQPIEGITMILGGSAWMGPKTQSAPLASVTVSPVHRDEYGRTVVTVTNASNRDMTAVAFDIPPGKSPNRAFLVIEEFLGEAEFLHPGTTAILFGGEEEEFESLVPSAVVYSDLSTEATNKLALEKIRDYREGVALAYERAVELSTKTSDAEKLADELQAESDPQQHSMPPLIKKKKPETPDKPSPDSQAKTSDRPTPDLAVLHDIAQKILDGRSIEDIREQAVRWRTHSKIEGGAAEKKE